MNDTNSPRDAQDRTGFRLVGGGLHRTETIHGVVVVHGPEQRPPFVVEALVAEEDTCLVLSTPADVVVTPEHPVRVMTEVHTAQPLVPGSVVVRHGEPLRFLAIVHDLDLEPSCDEAWVLSALEQVFVEAEARGLCAIGLPMIGTLHGKLAPERFMALLTDALQRGAESLQRIWLISRPQ
jgi:hypothetical protein